MAASDFLFSIGADPQAADAAVDAFVKRTSAALSSLEKINTISSQGAARAVRSQESLLKVANQRLAVEEKIAAAQAKQKAPSQTAAASGGGNRGGGGFADVSAIATRNAGAIGKQKDALDFLNRIMGNTIFKFIEYELVMKAFNSAVGEVMNSLNEASNVQMEQTLQRLYNSQIDVNKALKDSIIIAKQWGSDITDVQQVIGLWTKQTSQMHDATGKLVDSQTALAAAAKLAAESEQFHRASGIDSLEVYTKSISMWHELGISLGEIPGLYDKIAFAATKMARPLKAQPGSGNKEEGIKDIFDAVAESGATLKAQGMDESTIIATVAQQVENLGSQGSKAGTLISTLFGSLNQGGKSLREWVSILGPGAFKDSETFMDSLIAHVDELKKAQADGFLRVKPTTQNAWRSILETLDSIKKKADEIRGKSGGFLELISEAQMSTFSGQSDRLKASFQELNLALGTQLLPTATRFISFLSGTMLPILAKNSGAIVGMVQAGMMLGGAYLIMLGITKVGAAYAAVGKELAAFRGETVAASLTAEQFGAAELSTVEGMEAATAEMNLQKAALARLNAQLAVVEWQTGGYAKALVALGVTEADVAAITETRLPGALATAGAAMGGFAARALAAAGPLLILYTAMETIAGAANAFDSESNFTNTLKTDMVHKRGLGSSVGYALNPMNFGSVVQSDISSVTGKDDLAHAQYNNLKHSDPELQKLDRELQASHDSAHKDALQEQIRPRAGADYQTRHFKDVPGYKGLDHIPPWLQKLMDQAKGGTPAGMTMPDPAAGTKSKQATEQQIAAEGVNKDKADAMAQISKYRDWANAAESYIKTLIEAAKQNGYTEDTVNKLAAAFAHQARAIKGGEDATKSEIVTLIEQKKHLEALVATHGDHIDSKGKVEGSNHSSTVYAEAKAWRMADEAITKAHGNLGLYIAQKERLAQTRSTTMGEAEAWLAASAAYPKSDNKNAGSAPTDWLGHRISVPGSSSGNPLASPEALTNTISTLTDNITNATTNSGKTTQAQGAINYLTQLTEIIEKLYDSVKTKNPAEAQAFGAMLIQIGHSAKEYSKDLADSAKGTTEFNKSLGDALAQITTKNNGDVGKLLGLDPSAIASQKSLIDGYNAINDALTKMGQGIQAQAGGYSGLDSTQRDIVQQTVRQYELQQQLIPLLQQQEQIQDSIAYKATEAALQKAGEAQLDETITRLMGHSNNASTREAQYKAAVSGDTMSSMQSLFHDYLTNVVTQWWGQTVKSFTNQLFGSPAQQAEALQKKMLEDNRNGLNTIVKNEKTQVVDALNAWEKLFAKDVNNFVKASGGSTGSTGGGGGGGQQPNSNDDYNDFTGEFDNNGNGPRAGSSGRKSHVGVRHDGKKLGTDDTPMVVTGVGDGTMGTFSGSQSQAALSQAVATGMDASANVQKIADKADKDASNESGGNPGPDNPDDNGPAPVTGTGGAPSLGTTPASGLLSGLLGSIPGFSKFMASQGGQDVSAVIGAAGAGYGIGETIGGAGSTNGDFGAIGGALGAGLGLIGGPVVSALAGEAGGILGGLFGHKDNPADEPDVYDTQNYGQFVANINGAPGTFNGVTIAPQAQYSRAAGQPDMSRQMQEWAQKNPNDPLAKQIIALGPQSGIAAEKDGTFTLGDGQTISVTAYEALGAAWQAKAGNQSNAPLVSVNSYGGGSAASAYGTPGMDSATFLAQEQAWASGRSGDTSGQNAPLYGGGGAGGGGGGGSGGGSGGGANGDATLGGSAGFASGPTIMPSMAMSTPGYGGASNSPYAYASGANLTMIALQFSTPLYLDGKLVTTVVNAYNAQTASSRGKGMGH